MRRTRTIALMAVLVALAWALGLLFMHVPNVELMTFVVFASGYLIGARAGAAIGAASKTVLMVFPGLLAHYEEMDVLTRVREKIGRPGGIPGLWKLIPADQQSPLPVIDGKPVPVIGPAE